MVAEQRRNDIGSKVLISVVAILVTLIMGFATATSQRVAAETRINAIDISAIKVNQENVKDILCEMRRDIKTLLTENNK